MPSMPLEKRAKLARERLGFKNEQAAADAIGCSRTLVISWEDGSAKSIGGKYLLAAARVYKVDPEWLRLKTDADGYPFGGSQPVRIDVATLRSATATLLRLCEQWDLSFDPVEDADLVADFYARAVADGGKISGDNVIKLSDILKRRAAQLKETRDDTAEPGRAGKNPQRKSRAQA